MIKPKLLLLLLPLVWLLAPLQPAHAASDTTVVLNVHSYVAYTLSENSGSEAAARTMTPPVIGATFRAYNITTPFNALQHADLGDNQATMTTIALNWAEYRQKATELTTATTDDEGIATFTLARTVGGLDQVYLFEQVAGPANLLNPLPTVVGLNDEAPDKLTVYPKSGGLQADLLTADGTVQTTPNSVALGTLLSYRATFTLPSDLKQASTLSLSEAMSASGTQLVGDAFHLAANGQDVSAVLSTATIADNRVEWNLTDASAKDLLALAGQTLTLTYQRRVIDPAPTVDLTSTVSLALTQEGRTTTLTATSALSETGGALFLARDAYSKLGLEGVGLVVSRTTDGQREYAHFGQLLSWGSQADATIIHSDDSGNVLVTGLSSGDYQLSVAKTPAGFHAADPVDFTVADAAVGTTELKVQPLDFAPDAFGLPATGSLVLLVLLTTGALLIFVGRRLQRRHG